MAEHSMEDALAALDAGTSTVSQYVEARRCGFTPVARTLFFERDALECELTLTNGLLTTRLRACLQIA